MSIAPTDQPRIAKTQSTLRRRPRPVRPVKTKPAAAPRELTPRQRETLFHIAEGHSTKEIAASLGVSVKTVETHRAQLKERLGIYNVAGLVRHALRLGIISVD